MVCDRGTPAPFRFDALPVTADPAFITGNPLGDLEGETRQV
jgi:hypothetical protein